jgi:hypothetical protein
MSTKKWTHRDVQAPRLRILLDPVLQRRFWAKTVKHPHSDCVIWTGAGDRYGNYGWTNPDTGKFIQLGAHVVSFILYNKRDVKSGSVVRHSCDNTKCVNPLHLVEGSQRDNIHDKLSRGRHPNRYRSRRLPDALVLSIRDACVNADDTGFSSYHIAEQFGVSRSTVNHIKHGTRYTDVL